MTLSHRPVGADQSTDRKDGVLAPGARRRLGSACPRANGCCGPWGDVMAGVQVAHAARVGQGGVVVDTAAQKGAARVARLEVVSALSAAQSTSPWTAQHGRCSVARTGARALLAAAGLPRRRTAQLSTRTRRLADGRSDSHRAERGAGTPSSATHAAPLDKLGTCAPPSVRAWGRRLTR